LSFVISHHTDLISLAQKILNHNTIHIDQSIIIHNGIHVFQLFIILLIIVSFIATTGQIAFAILFAQCANDKSHTAKIKGILNKLLIKFLEFLKYEVFFV
jgi:hypothetical protein